MAAAMAAMWRRTMGLGWRKAARPPAGRETERGWYRAAFATDAAPDGDRTATPVSVPVSLPDDNGKVTLTVPLGQVSTRFRLPLTMSVYDLICDLKHELHWATGGRAKPPLEAPPAPQRTRAAVAAAAAAAAATRSARRVRVVDASGHEMDQSLPLSEALKSPFTIDLGGHASICPDGRAFTAYLAALKVEQAELRSERDFLDSLETLANRRGEQRSVAVRLGVGGFLFGQLGVIVYLTYDIGWDIMEPTTYLLGLANAILGYAVFIGTGQDFSFQVHLEAALERLRQRHLVRLGYDARRRDYVRGRLDRLDRLLRLYEKPTVRDAWSVPRPPEATSSFDVAEV